MTGVKPRIIWDANSLDPQSKLLVWLVPIRRTTRTIHQVVADAAERLAPKAGLPALNRELKLKLIEQTIVTDEERLTDQKIAEIRQKQQERGEESFVG